MSRHDGRVLVARYTVDFSVTTLTTSYTTAVISSLGMNVNSVYIENTSGTPVSIGYGNGATITEGDISPINNNSHRGLMLNAKQSIYLKSAGAASITTGKFLICLYN